MDANRDPLTTDNFNLNDVLLRVTNLSLNDSGIYTCSILLQHNETYVLHHTDTYDVVVQGMAYTIKVLACYNIILVSVYLS